MSTSPPPEDDPWFIEGGNDPDDTETSSRLLPIGCLNALWTMLWPLRQIFRGFGWFLRQYTPGIMVASLALCILASAGFSMWAYLEYDFDIACGGDEDHGVTGTVDGWILWYLWKTEASAWTALKTFKSNPFDRKRQGQEQELKRHRRVTELIGRMHHEFPVNPVIDEKGPKAATIAGAGRYAKTNTAISGKRPANVPAATSALTKKAKRY